MTDITVQNLINYFSENNFDNFNCGYTAGTAIAILLIFLLFTLRYLIKSRSKLKEVVVYTGGGELRIASSAIVDFIKIVASNIHNITVSKVTIKKHRNNIILNMKVEYYVKECPLPELADELRFAVLENLKNKLGVENVSKINIKPVSISGTSSSLIISNYETK